MMMTDRCLRVLFTVSLFLALVTAPSYAMVIQDGESDEVSIDTYLDGGATSIADTTPEPPSEPPPLSGIELLRNIGWGCGLIKPISQLPLDRIMGRWYLLEIFSPSSQKRQDACAGVDFWRWDDEENNLMPEVAPPPIVGHEHLVMRGFNKHVNDHHQSSYRVDTTAIVHGSRGAIWNQPGERTGKPCACTRRGSAFGPSREFSSAPSNTGAGASTSTNASVSPQPSLQPCADLRRFRRELEPQQRTGNATPAVRSVSACTLSMGATVAVLDFTPDARYMTVTTCVRAIGLEWTSVLGRNPNDTAVLPRDELHERLRAAGLRYVHNSWLQDNSECKYP